MYSFPYMHKSFIITISKTSLSADGVVSDVTPRSSFSLSLVMESGSPHWTGQQHVVGTPAALSCRFALSCRRALLYPVASLTHHASHSSPPLESPALHPQGVESRSDRGAVAGQVAGKPRPSIQESRSARLPKRAQSPVSWGPGGV
jgi:hypothetical protein